MPAITIILGMMLLLVGVGSYGWAMVDAARNGGYASPTALIPAVFGVILLVLGGVATSVKLRKHAMHAAVGIALIGFLAVASTLGIRNYTNISNLFTGKPVANPIALGSQIFMAVVCLLLVILGVNSFIQARRKKVISN